ncbi:MAG: DUF11 domain-containing protein [Sideroxydans sp.]|nr:DUF11 domain-containing protein [Sideroxydans sp.]
MSPASINPVTPQIIRSRSMEIKATMKIITTISRFICAALFSVLAMPQLAHADWVGESQTTKFLEQSTISMLATRAQTGGSGFQIGDEINYIIQFSPVSGGGTETVGAGAYVTDYIPAGTEVVNAEFVQLDGSGNYSHIAPPQPAQVLAPYVPMYSETGIFFSTDPRTAYYSTPNGAPISTDPAPGNGYALPPAVGATPLTSTHNFWDQQMTTTYAAAVRQPATLACAPPALAVLGSSPVAGPDTLLKTDYVLGGQGPWQRISYSGSMYGTAVGVVGPNLGCIGGVPTSAGWPLSSANPLPSNTNAVRFAGGQVAVGQLFSVRITLRVTQPLPINGLINNSEVFGGDASLTGATLIGKDNMWKYHSPSAANNNTSLAVIKQVVGMCVPVAPATTCTPQPFSGSAVPSAANLTLRYQITYLNTSASTQSGVVLSDVLPVGGALVPGTATIISGFNILPTIANGLGFSFQPIGSLGSGSGGVVQFDVKFAAAPAIGIAKTNKAVLSSAQVTNGVTSVAVVTPTLTANLNLGKTTSTPNRTPTAPSNVASYTITIPNNGGGIASSITVTDVLPSAGGLTVAERFSYQALSATAFVTSPPVFPAIVPTVTPVIVTPLVAVAAVAPYVGQNREQVTFNLPVGFTLPSGSSLTINFNALVGANVPASATSYFNDAKVTYLGGAAGALLPTTLNVQGAAPVKVSIPLALTKTIECVYAGLVCVPYQAGSPIPTAGKIKYRLNYANTDILAAGAVVLKDTLPLNTTFVLGSAAEVGTIYGITPPTVLGQVVTFGAIPSLPPGATGAVTFDVQLASALLLPSGSYITNNASISSATYPAGIAASLTTQVRDAANLVVTKSTTTPTIAPNGAATYVITLKNTGSLPATAISVVDSLPFTGVIANAQTRFNYLATTSVMLTPAVGLPTGLTVVPTTTIGALNAPPYNTNLNQQQVTWNLTTALPTGLAAGDQVTITFTAQPFAAPALTTALMPSDTTLYRNDMKALYTSLGAGVIQTGMNGVAPVKIPPILSITKSIDCVYVGAICTPGSYTAGMSIPASAKVKYKLTYTNLSATLTQTNVVLSDTLPTQTAAGSVSLVTLVSGTTPPTTVIAPAAPVAAGTFTFATIPTLLPNASGVVTFDVLTNAAVGTAAVTNTARVTSVQDGGGATSSVTHSVPVNLSITKTIDCVYLGVAPGVCTPGSFTPGMGLPVNAKIRYKLSYQNIGTAAQTNVVLSDILPTQTLANSVSLVTLVSGTTPPTTIITPAAPAAAGTFSFATIPTLAPGATGVVMFDVQTNAANLVVTNTGKIVSAEDAVGRTSAVSATVAALSITKTIDCVYLGVAPGVCTPGSYVAGSGIPPLAKIRYKIAYQNIGGVAQTNVIVSDTLPTQTLANSVSLVTTGGVTPPPTAAITPAAPAAAGIFSFATIPTLAPGASGWVMFDVQTNAAAAALVTNTGKVVSALDAVGVTSAVAASVTSLNLTKTISCVYSGLTCNPGTYVPGTLIPAGAKIKYALTYTNTGAANILTASTLCDQLPLQVGPFVTSVTNFVYTPAQGTVGAPAAGAPASPAVAGCGFAVAPVTPNIKFSFPNIARLNAGVTGTITYDVQTTAVNGDVVTNLGKMVNGTQVVSSSVSATVGVATAPNLAISKTTSTPSTGPNGTATYTITVQNTGTAPTTSLKVYDFLPYSGAVVDATKRFNYATTTGYTGTALPVPTITAVAPPTVSPFSSNTNQQQVLWDFGAYVLAAGSSMTITFNATAGSALPVGTYRNAAAAEYTSATGPGNVNTVATAPINITNMPSIMLLKTVQIYSDPVNGVNNPSAIPTPIYAKFIPGAVAGYTISAFNSGGPADTDTIAITDPVPSNTAMFVNDIGLAGSGPVMFSQGATSSTLTYNYTSLASMTDDIDFFGGTPVAAWGYVPTPDPITGCDPLVSQIKISPKGIFVGSPVAPSPSFNLNFRVCVK